MEKKQLLKKKKIHTQRFLGKKNYFEKKSQQYFCIKSIYNEKLRKSFIIDSDRKGLTMDYLRYQTVLHKKHSFISFPSTYKKT